MSLEAMINTMRFWIMTLLWVLTAGYAFAQPPVPVTDLSEFNRPGAVPHQWRNQSPDQPRALNQFYQSMAPAPTAPAGSQREQHAKQLRSMSPQQRQQLFLNYIKQNRR